ncbi:hypothetical protein GCM10007052_13920 [Halioglobus japonicus]|uniref:DUF1631 domain-containing protein n=1 Tax=Halioglobus japonicus TaxID=930805 RepID=A0AAP8MEP9_9GAMM|nr:DUF1631 family protein [Halioglobus japonicus]PLW86471.1 DUF1631 domain-containing protein [Halioglobus japonicus]GHD12658.1 hypothetical protein GCM10007052_13920 [Halioglobus japonicus]
MPGAPEQPPSLHAMLELETSARLAGQLAVLDRSEFTLAQVQLIQGATTGDKVRVKPGIEATLYYNPDEPDEKVTIQVSAIDGKNLTLRLLETGHRDTILRLLARQEQKSLSDAEHELKGSSAEHTRLLRELRTRSMLRVSELFKHFLHDLVPHLVEKSAQAGNRNDQGHPLYDGANKIRHEMERLSQITLDTVAGYFNELCPPEGGRSFTQGGTPADQLDLVDLNDYEHDLAINRMVAMGEEQHALPLEALILRTAKLISADPLQVRLPIHPRQLSQAFQIGISSLELPPEAAGASYDYFARKVIRKLDEPYQHLNSFLEEHGIGGGLEERIRTKGSLLRPPTTGTTTRNPRSGPPAAVESHASSDGQGEQAHTAAAPQTTPGSIDPSALSMYQSIIDALNLRRGLGVQQAAPDNWGAPVDGTANTNPLADARAVASALGSIQRDTAVQAALREATSLREFLADHREQLGDLQGTGGLSADSLNQLDLVDNLFGTIHAELNVNDELKPALSNLQIPLAKLALLDQTFFADRGHVARDMVDKLSSLATSANFPNRVLEERINHVVDEIVKDYDQDDAVFSRALSKIDRLLDQQQRAIARNVERVVRTQEGQEKLHQARRAVSDVINERIRPPAAPRVLLDLVESGYRDLLVLTHVKEGPDSQVWSDQVNSLDLLVSWLAQLQDGDADRDVGMQRGMEAETLLDMVGQQITSALPTNVAHESVLEELRDILTNNQSVESAEVDATPTSEDKDTEALHSKVRELPRLRRWVRRVEQLQPDSWLSYRDAQGQRHRMRLAWISEEKDRFIFVDERGHKTADLNAVQLARKLSRGAQTPTPSDDMSVVDKSIYRTLEQAQKTLSFARNHDSLTQLVNRDTFVNQLERALNHARRKQTQHALLYINVDQFDLVNQVYDQVSGDQVLLEFSKLLAQLHGKKCSSARLEGDEFALLLLDRSAEQAAQLGEKIRSDIEQASLDIEGEKVSFTVSIGVAPILEHSQAAAELLESARVAMHHAKEQGRNRVEMYHEDQAQATTYQNEKDRSREDLEQALATDRFVLRAQPIVQSAVDGDTPQRRHYELLLALRNKDGSITSPEEFIQSAEQYGFMTLVDRWVIREAFSWISQLMDDQKEVPHLAINLSGVSVTDDDFMEYLLEQISEFGVGTSLICFEITETGTISNLVKAADFVQAFRNIGCKFSIDDFGTGLASHNYLRELPVDYVKIDGTFISNIHHSRADYAMARSINDLAHFLGQETIAESVENDEIIAKLKEIGVDYLQGWGVGKPKPLSEITAELSTIAR